MSAGGRETLTGEEFDAAVEGSRFNGRAFEGARAVLVGGETVRGAARARGISNSAVQQAIDRIMARRRARSS